MKTKLKQYQKRIKVSYSDKLFSTFLWGKNLEEFRFLFHIGFSFIQFTDMGLREGGIWAADPKCVLISKKVPSKY